jgi:hypothetical protein
LDSQILWSELHALVPETLRTEYERARASVDFFIALMWLDGVLALLMISVAVLRDGSALLLLIAVIGIGFELLLYHWAILATSYLRSTVQGLVNVGRLPLAESLGLKIPESIEHERLMWEAVSRFIFWDRESPESKAYQLRKYRVKSKSNAA